MKKKRKNSNLWLHLESTGILAHGTPEEIATEKQKYWRAYHYNHRKVQRQEKPEFVVALDRTDGTYDRISQAAKKHKLTIPAYLRTAAVAYLTQVYIVPDRDHIAHLEQLLSQCANEVQALAGVKEKYFWQREQKIEAIEARIERLEKEIAELFRHPQSIEEYLRKIIKQVPEIKNRLIALINSP